VALLISLDEQPLNKDHINNNLEMMTTYVPGRFVKCNRCRKVFFGERGVRTHRSRCQNSSSLEVDVSAIRSPATSLSTAPVERINADEPADDILLILATAILGSFDICNFDDLAELVSLFRRSVDWPHAKWVDPLAQVLNELLDV